MMKHSKMAKRSLSALLALVMLLSCFGGITLTASAAEAPVTVTVGKLVADNYDLTVAEKALLSSGYLAGSDTTITYQEPAGNPVTVSTDDKIITAETVATGAFQWIPTGAEIVVNGSPVETVELTLDGAVYKGNYDYAENAFSVVVNYTLDTTEVTVDAQNALFGAMAALKQGVANLETVAGQGGNLYILEQAMPELVNFANNGVATSFGGTLSFSAACKEAINALNGQMTANDGQLDLSVKIAEYDVSMSTEYLLKKSEEMKNAVADLVANVSTINIALTTMVDNLETFIENGWVSAALADQLTTLAGVCKNLEDGLTVVDADEWTAAGAGTTLVSGGNNFANYAELDSLVEALGTLTTVEPTEELHIADAKVQVNMSMFDLTINVVLNTVQNNVVDQYGEKSVALTLAENATAHEILDAIEANGIEATAIAEWGDDYAYVEGKFERTTTTLPETLTEDITYTITYNPKTFNVTYDYAEAEQLPYGYVITLPVHGDQTKSYDYRVNGTKYAQGSVITITDTTIITRSSGKAYTTTDLYTVVANNYGNDVTKAILQAGALKDNVVISVRKPDPADAGSLLALANDVLTAENYDASYNSLQWKPYTYGAGGTENKFNGSTATWDDIAANVQYKLTLTNFAVSEVEDILGLAEELKSEAKAQKDTLDRLVAYYDTMGQLDKAKLGALNGVIDVTDFTPGDGADTDAKNLELRAYFKGLVSGIIANNLDSNNKLKLYNMLGEYDEDGLSYYYDNSAIVINEIDTLSDALSGMMGEQEALEIMVGAAGYPEYAEKIANLEGIMASVKAALTAPNAKIDLESNNLSKLITALEADDDVVNQTADYPYLISDNLLAKTADRVGIQVLVSVPDGNGGELTGSFTTDTVTVGETLSDADIEKIESEIEDFVKEKLGDDCAAYFTLEKDIDLEEYKGKVINYDVNGEYTYTANTYTLKIDGSLITNEITVYNLEVELPEHTTEGWVYYYQIGDTEYKQGKHTFTKEDLTALFDGGVLNITSREFNEAAAEVKQKLEQMVADLNVKLGDDAVKLIEENDKYTGIVANVDAGQMQDLIMGLMAYSYVGINGEGLLYLNDENSLELSMQTLINAMMSDEEFGLDRILDIVNNNGGTLIDATMQLGNSADPLDYDLTFQLNLTTVPEKLKEMADKLDQSYATFKGSDENAFDVELTLPDAVYGAYLAALTATGYADKTELENVDAEVALQFICDYINTLMEFKKDGADLHTIQNTLNKLGQDDFVLSAYQRYYEIISDNMTCTVDEQNDKMDVVLPFQGDVIIEELLGALGMNTEGMDTFLSMIKENKEGGEIVINAAITLTNTAKTYSALIVDAQAIGLTEKFEAPAGYTALYAALEELDGCSAIILLDDVKGDLFIGGETVVNVNGKNVNGASILDLNGKTVDGNITVKDGAELIIVDSTIGNTGTVTGTISGTVHITGGNYTNSVENYLKKGFVETYNATGEMYVVTNELYRISGTEDDIVVTLKSDFAMKPTQDMILAMLADLGADVLLNFFDASALSVDGTYLYKVNFENAIAWYTGGNRIDNAIDIVADSTSLTDMKKFAKDLATAIFSFDTVVKNEGKIASYEVATNPWQLEIVHNEEDNYLDFSIVANTKTTKTRNITFMVDEELALSLYEELANIVTDVSASVDELDIDYDLTDREFELTVGASASATIDLVGEESDAEYNTAYLTALALALNNADMPELLKAINEELHPIKLKAVFDEITVADLIKAVKALEWDETFVDMAKENVEIDVDLNNVDEAYRKIATAFGWALDYLDIVGPATAAGAFDDGTGTYSYSRENVSRTVDGTARGYTARLNATVVSASLSIRVFNIAKLEPLTFTDDAKYDIPESVVGEEIEKIDVSKAVSGGLEPYTYKADGLPAGIVIDPATGVISGTPTEATTESNAKITVTDDLGDSKSITIEFGAVKLPETIEDPAIGTVEIDDAWYVEIKCSTSGSSIYYCINDEAEPYDWMLYSKPFEITETVTVRAQARKGNLVSKIITEVVAPEISELIFADSDTYNIPATQVGDAIAVIDVASGVTGGKLPYSFSASRLPDGIIITAEGKIQGIPTEVTEAGTATITVTDAAENYATITISYGAITAKILPKVAAPVITAENGTVTITCDEEGAYIYYTTDADKPYNYVLYTVPFEIEESVTVRAYATKDGMEDSDIVWLDVEYIAYTVKNYTGKADDDTYTVTGDIINVRNNKACVVLIEHTDGTYTRLTASKNATEGYDFDISDIKSGENIVIAVKGDLDSNGIVDTTDVTTVRKSLLASSNAFYAELDALGAIVADVDVNGYVDTTDITAIRKSLMAETNQFFAAIEW